jgi:SAM-dependent methyltransferase
MHAPPPPTATAAYPAPHSSWHTTAAGQYALGWQAERYAQAAAGVFGYYALQLGCPALPSLAASRIAHRWLALQGEACDFAAPQLRVDYHALPLQEASVDLLTLPHTLEHSADPHLTLRDAARALVPQGRLLISGFNPRGLWFSPTLLPRRRQLGLPDAAQLISLPTLRQLLQAHGLHIERVQYGCWQRLRGGDTPPYPQAARTEIWGQRLLPHWGGCYFVEASKQVLGAHLLQAHWQNRWKIRPLAAAQPAAFIPKNHSFSGSFDGLKGKKHPKK